MLNLDFAQCVTITVFPPLGGVPRDFGLLDARCAHVSRTRPTGLRTISLDIAVMYDVSITYIVSVPPAVGG